MSNDQKIYQDIALRTGGHIHIGVVGPVRTGKSTFIRKLMEAVILPNIENEEDRRRAADASPQSADGRTVTTTEPKFIPNEAVSVKPDGQTEMKMRLIDCVGYWVEGALGDTENDAPRMVHTPWSEAPVPFRTAADHGTHRVIRNHATLALLVTTDGTICGIPRESYEEAEKKAAEELQRCEKPFAVILNSAHPEEESAVTLAYTLEKQYNAPVALVNCTELSARDIEEIFSMLLHEFPLTEIRFRLPDFTKSLPKTHWLKQSVAEACRTVAGGVTKMGDIQSALLLAGEGDVVKKWELTSLAADSGKAEIALAFEPSLFYRVASELSGEEIASDADILAALSRLAEKKRAYDRVESALEEVEAKGYGIVSPRPVDLELQKPEIVKVSGGYGLRLRAAAKSIHMIRADIETEICPSVGSEAESEELLRSLLGEFEEKPEEIWSSRIFGKSLYELVNEGLNKKLAHMPEESRERLSDTLSRIINEGSNGLICILL